MTDELKPLSKKHKAFAEHYLKMFNGTQAYLLVYPKASYEAARTSASELLAKPNIKAYIDDRLSALQMSVDEALKLTADIARGDIAQLMEVSSVGFSLDMSKAKELGLTGLIKKVKQKTVTHIAKSESDEDREVIELEVELYDKQTALRDILKIHGRFTDKVDISNSDGSLKPENMKPSEIAARVAALLKDKNAG